MDGSTGIISGTPTAAETCNFTIKASNAFGYDQKSFAIAIENTVEPTLADSNKNTVICTSGGSGVGSAKDPFVLTAGTAANFTAIGDLEARAPEVEGDTQFIAIDWSMNSSGTFGDTSPYTFSASLDTAGAHTLKVNFRENAWNGTAWVATGNIDTKTYSVQVMACPHFLYQPKC